VWAKVPIVGGDDSIVASINGSWAPEAIITPNTTTPTVWPPRCPQPRTSGG